MEQKVPIINSDDIERIIKRDFPQFQFSEVMNILMKYVSQSEEGRFRVYASILKLSGGDIRLVKEYIEKANADFRDVISLSEYPNYSRYALESDLSEEKEEELIKDDWIQYKTWLEK